MAGHMSASFFARANTTTGSSSGSSRRSSKHQSVDSPPPTLPLAILNSSPETSNVDGDEAYDYERPQHQQPLHELKGRCWSTFFAAPSSSQLLSAALSPRRKSASHHSNRGDVMRMPGVEMGQYGVLPETDPFTVVVCDLCKAAVKPQGLQKHVHRHNQAAAAVTTSDVNTLASLIPPCIVSVNALKFDPKAENSNSSTSSVYNLAGGGGSFEASSSSSSNQGPADGVVASSSSSFLHEQQQDFVNVTANTPPPTAILSKSGGKPGSLKIKLSKSAMKSGGGGGGGGNTICSSSSSSSSSSTSTSTSSMTNLIGNRSVSASPNVPPATASSSNDHPPPTVEPPPIPAPTKKLGLKEREYDANKHCGVLLDTGKHCTRTLTCKSHALSLRRQVSGRSAEFDKLLADHRAMRAALLASGGKAAATTPVLLPPPPVPVAPTAVESQSSSLKRESSDNNNGHSHSHSHSHHHHHHHRHHHDRLDSQPPAKRQHMERQSSRSERNSHRGGEVTNSKHNQVGASMKMKIKAEPMDEEAEGGGGDNEATPTLEDPPPFRGNNNSHHHHSNGFELHGRSQLVASSNGGYFIKSESQLATDEMIVETATNPGEALELENDADFHHHHQVDVDEEAEKLKAPSIITVPVTMLGNVMYVNGRNCILEAAAPTSIDEEQGEEELENRPFEIAGTKGRHVEVVLDRESGERRRYLTLSAGQQQRATNRMRLNVIKTEQATDVGKNNNGDQSVVISAAEFPGIDTWYTQIPKPTYVNCFKLCKLGTSSAVLSKRYLNIRKSLIMNMTSSGGHLHHHSHSHHHHLHQGGSPVSALNRSNSQSGNSPGGGGGGSRLLNSGAGSVAGAAVGGGGGGGFGGVEKVNFNVERIKV